MQISCKDYKSKFHSNNTNSIFSNFLGINVESLIRTGSKLDFFVFTQNSNQKENDLKRYNPNFNKLSYIKESEFAQSYKNGLNNIKLLFTYQDFDLLEFTQIHENQHLKIRKRCECPVRSINTPKNDILPLFDLLINNINQILLKNVNFQDQKELSNSSFNENPSISNDTDIIDRYIIHDINNFFGSEKQTQLFLEKKDYKCSVFPVKLLNNYYKVCSKSLIELAIQLIRIISITILRNKYKLFNIYPELIIILSSLIFICLDIIFYLFNWKSAPKIGMAIDIIHFVFIFLSFCHITNLNTEIFDICGCLLYYSYIYRIIFILQCKFISKYNKFQVTEIIRTQLKRIFFSFGNDMNLMISSSKFEDICGELGIDNFFKSNLINRSLETYLFQNLDWISGELFKFKYINPISYTRESYFKINLNVDRHILLINRQYYLCIKQVCTKLCLFYKIQIYSLFRYFYINLKFNYFILLKDLPRKIIRFKYPDKKNNSTTYQEYILKKRNLTYEEFETLLISLDSKRRLLNKIETNTGLFDIINGSCLLQQRKIIFEQSFYNITLFILLAISITFIAETVINYFGDNLSKIKNFVSIIQAYLYLLIVITSSIFHYKLDKMYYNSSLKSYNRIISIYNLIYGNSQLIEKDHLHNNFSRNDYLAEFLSYHNAELLEKYVNSFSKYLPKGIAISLLKKYEFSALNPQYKEITILFSDIVGFTNIAEKVSPFLLFHLLTNYFDEMVNIIEEFNGNLLEIAGDAILAIWNSPVAVENHSVAAISASLKMKKQLKLKFKSFENNYFPEINIKCGIHTDHVLIGNIGCNKRMKYGIMGDGVNLASRIESLTKRYSVDIIISNNVFANKKVQKKFIICPLDIVIVQGKSNPTVIYHVLNTIYDSDLVSLLKSKFHTKALIFFINKNFKKSLLYIEKINKLGPFKIDPSTINLSNKCKHFQDKKLDINWSCAEVLNTKYFNE
ncbi:membrane associated adenyl cyclase [Cryptosporidium ubiquitum]|uniref:Membrane associated adenyl cyclase n=1 Tax=Cryptosporidium ubiquitum TaxID=857276 RepID=A0A1J4MM02_9CRYT|nr:membrane associated adenyl cyclase [Cryptosporidium ubiquitum]OII75298.1 membrane associated adenyl cyclase [Cryptosporidium ubiquitum]